MRDNRTYWVQKLADGRCWMLTNLAYAGGGNNSYGDVKALTVGTTNSYTQPHYFIPTGANPTNEPANPSTSTTGTGQYGTNPAIARGKSRGMAIRCIAN